MSNKTRVQYADAKGALTEKPVVGILFATLAAAPTASAAGYAKGCIFINTSGSVGTLVYVNTGSNTSATWTNIV